MTLESKVVIGKVKRNIYGNWEDVDKGLFIDTETVEQIFRDYEDRTIKVTIEEVEEEDDDKNS